MDVIGLRQLNKAVSAQVARFGINGAVCDNEFAYYFNKGIITYRIYEDDSDKYYSTFVLERFGYKDIYPFVLSLLHEVGHCMANDEIEGEIYHFCQEEKTRIYKEFKNANDAYKKILLYQYFNLPDEIMATQWAVKFAKSNPAIIKEIWEVIHKELYNFYKQNLNEKEWKEI